MLPSLIGYFMFHTLLLCDYTVHIKFMYLISDFQLLTQFYFYENFYFTFIFILINFYLLLISLLTWSIQNRLKIISSIDYLIVNKKLLETS